MEYHADRFHDFSLLAYAEEKLIALLPGNIDGNILYSHQGLTFGGWITDDSMKSATMLLLFEHLISYLKTQGVKELLYKCIPHLYHAVPAEEDRYALFRNNAKLIECNVTASIAHHYLPQFSERRKRGLRKAVKADLVVKESDQYDAYFAMLQALLQERFDRQPTHSLAELVNLIRRFPSNIRLFAAYKGAIMLAGVIIFESEYVAHAQYIASNEEGRRYGALDMIFNHLIHRALPQKRYFDFGTSNECQGQHLNEGLINYKEEFGACAIVHDVFRVSIQ